MCPTVIYWYWYWMKIMTKFTQLEIETNDRYRSFRFDTDIQFETNIYRLTLFGSQFRKMGSENKVHIWCHFPKIYVIWDLSPPFFAPKSNSENQGNTLKKSNLVKNGHFGLFFGHNLFKWLWYRWKPTGYLDNVDIHLFALGKYPLSGRHHKLTHDTMP